MHLQERGWNIMEWVYEAWEKDQWRILENTVTKLRVPEKVGNFLTIYQKKRLFHGVSKSWRSAKRNSKLQFGAPQHSLSRPKYHKGYFCPPEQLTNFQERNTIKELL